MEVLQYIRVEGQRAAEGSSDAEAIIDASAKNGHVICKRFGGYD